ncbi:MAG: cysteine hydrolase [Desulfobacterales bacterium]|nr:cysteine hydrolase [Desulfobacterales bacterium]
MRELGEFDEEYVLKRAEELYERAEAEILIDVKKTALIVVDMLDEFVKPNWTPCWIPEATRQVPKVKELINTCRDLGVPIIYLAYAFHPKNLDSPKPSRLMPGAKTLAAFRGELFLKESIYEEIKPKPDDMVIIKPSYSGFHGTKLDLVLKNLEVDTVVICGTMTNYCCGATAREAFWHGYKVVFGSDINSTDNKELHDAELKTLRRGYALVINCGDIIQALKGRGDYSIKNP